MRVMNKKQMTEVKSMTNIRKIEIEAGRVIKAKRVMNIRLIVYRNAQVIQMINKISENEIEMIV
jgi:hypothetical protein